MFDKLRKKFPQDKTKIDQLEVRKKVAEQLKEAVKFEAVQQMLDYLKTVVTTAEDKLAHPKKIESHDDMLRETIEAERLITDKERCQWIIYEFEKSEQILKEISQYVDRKLNKGGDKGKT